MAFLPAQPPSRDPQRRGWNALYANPLPWLIALTVAHIVIRVAISPSLKYDDAVQVVWAQRQLQWGYGAQPPLYTWLLWGMNQLLGPSVLALALLKHTLIALTCVFMWLAGRELLGPRGAWWAAASLFLLPAFGWASIINQTNTILVTTMACAMWWLVLRIVRREGRGCQREFAALGLACGCGMLAKYNFALPLAAFVVAVLSVREPRRALLGRGWWWTVLIGLVVVTPHGWWLLAHWRVATMDTVAKISTGHDWGTGLIALLETALGTLVLWVMVALATFGSGWWRRPASAPEIPGRSAAWLRPVFSRYLGLIALGLLAMVLVANVTVFHSRYVLPALAPVPLMAFALRPDLETDRRGNRFTGAALALIAAGLIAAGVRPWLAYITGKPDPLNYPVIQLAQALQKAGYDGKGRIIAANSMLAGALIMHFPAAQADFCSGEEGSSVADCVAGNVQMAERAGQGWLVIMRIDPLNPDQWQQALSHIPDNNSLPLGNLRLPDLMVRPDQPWGSYNFVWHPAPAQQP